MEAKLYVFNGEKLTIKEITDVTGLKYNTVYKRVERSDCTVGMDVSHLFTRKTKNYLFNGKEVTPEYLAKKLSLRPSTIRIMARKNGVKRGQDISEVINEYRKNRKNYIYKGRFTTAKEISKITGLSCSTLTSTLRKNGLGAGHEVSQFIEQYMWYPNNYGAKYVFKDKKLTIKEIAELTGCSYKRAADIVARHRDLKNDPGRDLSPYFDPEPGSK